jgi:hypothetical protein
MPKVIFKKMTKEENIDIVKWAFFEVDQSLDIYKYTTQYFPQLASLDKDLLAQKTINSIIEKLVSDSYDNNKEIIASEIKRYNEIWEKYNDEYFKVLSDYLKIKWPKERNVIEVSIGLIPVFPRCLDDFSFSMAINLKDWKVVETVAHEILHFGWFEKWQELYPDSLKEEFESPHDVWKYSEMVVDPILNSPQFQNIFSGLFKERAYDSFYELYDGKDKVMDKLSAIYDSDEIIDKKIKNGYEYISKVLNK